MSGGPVCRVYWGSHGCMYDRGHAGPHECRCAFVDDDPSRGRLPRVDEDGVLNVGAPPYYGRGTRFYGEDATMRQTTEGAEG